jgi:hypothetical protein
MRYRWWDARNVVHERPEALDEDAEGDFKHTGVDLAALQPPRRAATERLPHQQPEIERPSVNEQAFENVRVTVGYSLEARRKRCSRRRGCWWRSVPSWSTAIAASRRLGSSWLGESAGHRRRWAGRLKPSGSSHWLGSSNTRHIPTMVQLWTPCFGSAHRADVSRDAYRANLLARG